jgi:hypothetical protein
VHDLALLRPVQAVQLGQASGSDAHRCLATTSSAAASSASLAAIPGGGGGGGGGRLQGSGILGAGGVVLPGALPGGGGLEPLHDYIFLSGRDSVLLCRVMAIEAQVESLVSSHSAVGIGSGQQRFEEALALCALCPAHAARGGIDVNHIHERYAHALHARGDFEAAVGHFIEARSSPRHVLSLFPSFVPSSLPLPPTKASAGDGSSSSSAVAAAAAAASSSSSASPSSYASAAAAARAAAAVVRYLEAMREHTHGAAVEAERAREQRRRASTTFTPAGGSESGDGGDAGSGASRAASNYSDGTGGVGSSSETFRREHLRGGESEEQQEAVALQTATMVDTVLLVARLNCTPPRRWDVVDLLSKPNRCHEASCLPLLAERGVPYAEALLWLYRSVGAHERVLQNLTEEKCVNVADPDSWGVEEFQRWTSQ